MLKLYYLNYHNFHNSNIIDTNQFPLTNTLTGYYFTGPLFTSRLYNDIGVGELAYGSAINASQAADVISTYLSTRGYSVDMWVGNMPRKSKIVQQLEQGHPVIYVDQFDNPAGGDAVDHDIVIYGYDDENNLIAHFGWEGYAHVQATSDALAAFISSACAISSW